jgi:hypothetical protein
MIAACSGDSNRPTGNTPTNAVLTFQLEPAFAFCPELPCLFAAEINRLPSGGYFLSASGLREGIAGQDDCHEWSSAADTCVVEVPLPPRALSTSEARRLEQLLSLMPIAECEIDGATDPCRVQHFQVFGRALRSAPCVAGSDEYLEKLQALAMFLNELTGYVE